jgi:hypothetical protein
MPTGACGINCDVCRLNFLEICSTCGSGRSQKGREKLAAQLKIMGAPCPILACALEKSIAYCPKDCEEFPCDSFRRGPYPYSEGYLNMQERRYKEGLFHRAPSGDIVAVPVQYWEELKERAPGEICMNSLAKNHPPTGILLPFLKEYLLVDIEGRCLHRQSHGRWARAENPLLELVCLSYLLNAGPQSLSQQMVSAKELRTGHFFKGPHELKTQPLLNRYGNDLEGFRKAAERAGGEELVLADAAYRFEALPKIPLHYLLWKGDEEFSPRLSVLFDRSIEYHLAADAIWGLVTLVSDAILSVSSSSSAEKAS